MSKRAKVPIAEGQRLSEKYDAPIVIVFTLLDKGETINVMSYGASKALCRHAASLASQIADKVMNGTIAPTQIEPTHLPNEPMEWEGKSR